MSSPPLSKSAAAAHLVAEIVERIAHRLLGHGVALLLGAQQEVRDVGVEPEVAGVERTPEAEAAARGLVAEEARDRVLDPLVERIVVAHAEHLGDVVEIEQRQGAAGDLLGAAIGVAVERIEQLAAR